MRIILALLTLAFVLPISGAFAQSEGIAAVVNQDVISMTDLSDRMHMIIVSSNLPPSKEIKQKLVPQVLNDLVEEQLKVQEAKRNNITVTDQEVAQGFAMLAKQNNLQAEQFAEYMRRDGINPGTVERQIRAQLGWSKVIQEVLRGKVNVTDSDIDDYVARLDKAKGKSEYQVAEIFLPVGPDNPDVKTRELSQKLIEEIKSGKTTFFKVAQQFSSSAGAPRGGDLGWMQQGQLQPELEQALSGMQKEEVSQPIRTSEGYHILYLRDLRTVDAAMIPSREEIYSMIGIQRLERVQARQLMELRTTAFIENRVES